MNAKKSLKPSGLNIGFTIVELIVIIVVIGILASISVVSYGNWHRSVAVAQVKSDLNGVAAAMEDYRSFNNSYPASIPTTFTSSDGVVLSGGSSDGGKTYCVDAASTKDSTIHYHISSTTVGIQSIQQGVCGPLNLVATGVSSTSIDLSWDAVTSADSYNLQQASSAAFSDAITIATQATTKATSSGLSAATTYWYRVQATVNGIDGAWSIALSVTTNNTAINPPTVDPVVTVALNGANAQATITDDANCTTSGSVPQYALNSRTNNGAWTGYSAWYSTRAAAQTATAIVANDGVKYDYKAESRCYINSTSFSAARTSNVGTYIDPITTPSAPVVTANSDATTTTWSWPAVTCTAGTVGYQYDYTVYKGATLISDSGWQTNGTNPTVNFTTSTGGYTYTVYVQAKCTGTYTASSWSASGSAEYSRLEVFRQIAAGENHSCGITNSNKTYCWGRNNYGQLGDNSTNTSLVPIDITDSGALSGKTVKFIGVGDAHTCAITSDNYVYCWGWNDYGQVGDNSFSTRQVPTAIYTSGFLSGKTISSLAVGYRHNCVITSDNKAYCWGYDNDGQLGNNSTTDSAVPVAVTTSGALSGKVIISIGAGFVHTCAVAWDASSGNNAYCWGWNSYGQLGNNSTTDSHVPVPVYNDGVLNGLEVDHVAAGYTHTCAIASNNKAYCWGLNGLGHYSTTSSKIPVTVYTGGVLSGKTIKSLEVGDDHTCVITSDNNAYCWGHSNYGELGDGYTTDSNPPVAVYTGGALNGLTIKSFGIGHDHNCVIASNDNAYCWGRNGGNLGNGTTGDTHVPVLTQIP